MSRLTIEDVKKEVFDEMAEAFKISDPITIRYNGSTYKGTLTIESNPGDSTFFKKAVKKFSEIYTKGILSGDGE